MKHQFTAIIEPGERYLIATCPEAPDAHGQGTTREEALANLSAGAEKVIVELA